LLIEYDKSMAALFTIISVLLRVNSIDPFVLKTVSPDRGREEESKLIAVGIPMLITGIPSVV